MGAMAKIAGVKLCQAYKNMAPTLYHPCQPTYVHMIIDLQTSHV